jgi:hypothetical protein
LKLTRLDLGGAGSPSALVTRILAAEPDLPIPVPLEDLCTCLDIVAIRDLETEGFEAALVTDLLKASGAILVAANRSRQRRRFSIAHELGHFLIPLHLPPADGTLLCSAAHLSMQNVQHADRRRRMEAEANRFAALLLMPPPALRAALHQVRRLSLNDIVRLAARFDVSKEAMARACVDYSREAIAVIVAREGRVLRCYRRDGLFHWIAPASGQPVPAGSIGNNRLPQGTISAIESCEPELWLGLRDASMVAAMTEQVLWQRSGFALILLNAELRDEEDDESEAVDRRWQGRL